MKTAREVLKKFGLNITKMALEGRNWFKSQSKIDELCKEYEDQALNDLIALLPKIRNMKDSFLNEPYCKFCRKSEMFCKCEGFNKAIKKIHQIFKG